ncbi:MAG TPA: metal ABC transporter substrate-binding protein [Acidimicrobiia bacterium]
MITILIPTRNMRLASLGAALAVLLTLTGCSSSAGDGKEDLLVVATTSIWGDVVANVVGDNATVEVLIPTGADAHDFEPTSGQIASLQDADLVIANGLGLEEAMDDTLQTAVADGANVYEVAPDLDPLQLSGGEHEDEDGGEEESHDGEDPHVWFDPLRMATAAELIAERLTEIDGSVDWQQRAKVYAAELIRADEEISRILGGIDPEARKLVTNHEAMSYFAHRYEFEMIGVVVPGGSTLADPSSADLAALVEEIEHEKVSTIFAETTRPTRLAEAVAAEVGREVVVVELYTESLGEPGSGADSLVGMLLTDARLIAEALAR